MNNKNIIYSIIVILVIGVLVFVTLNGKKDAPLPEGSTEEQVSDTQAGANVAENNNMDDANVGQEGVTKTILVEGTGEVAKSGDVVSMSYTGSLSDGTVFDSNVDPKFGHAEPFTFNLGAGQVIQGWDEGIIGMKIGEKSKLVISPSYAYGVNGIPGVILPNSTLIFEVELLSISK